MRTIASSAYLTALLYVQREIDIVLRDVRRWTQNLYLSENLRRRDDFGDLRVRKLGQLFIEIGGLIDGEYIKYRKQFSLRKKFVRFMKNKFGQITNETTQKLKNLKASKPATAGWNEQGNEETVHGDGDGDGGGGRKHRHRHRHRHRHHRTDRSLKKRKRKSKKHRHRSKKGRTRKRESVSNHGTPTNHKNRSHSRARTVGVPLDLSMNRSLPTLAPNRSN